MFPTVDSRMEAHARARRIGGLSGYRITKPHRSEAYQEPCGNCAEAGIFAFFLNGRFERIPKPRSTAYPPDCHTILCALLHRCARTHGPNLAFDVEDLSAPQAHPRRDTAGLGGHGGVAQRSIGRYSHGPRSVPTHRSAKPPVQPRRLNA